MPNGSSLEAGGEDFRRLRFVIGFGRFVLVFGIGPDVVVVLLVLQTESHTGHLLQFARGDFDSRVKLEVTKNFTFMAGLNNVFDESYYSRVRSDGIDPGYGRNFYVGGSVQF